MTPVLSAIALLALLGCSHDTKRENPLDAELTPAVELQATLSDSTGAVALSWQPYRGDADFAAWWVLRNEVNSLVVDTLARLEVRGASDFTDTTLAPDTRYEYRVSVVNTAGFEAPSARSVVAGYSLSPIGDLTATPDPQAARILLQWPAYSGPKFTPQQIEDYLELGTALLSLLRRQSLDRG